MRKAHIPALHTSHARPRASREVTGQRWSAEPDRRRTGGHRRDPRPTRSDWAVDGTLVTTPTHTPEHTPPHAFIDIVDIHDFVDKAIEAFAAFTSLWLLFKGPKKAEARTSHNVNDPQRPTAHQQHDGGTPVSAEVVDRAPRA